MIDNFNNPHKKSLLLGSNLPSSSSLLQSSSAIATNSHSANYYSPNKQQHYINELVIQVPKSKEPLLARATSHAQLDHQQQKLMNDYMSTQDIPYNQPHSSYYKYLHQIQTDGENKHQSLASARKGSNLQSQTSLHTNPNLALIQSTSQQQSISQLELQRHNSSSASQIFSLKQQQNNNFQDKYQSYGTADLRTVSQNSNSQKAFSYSTQSTKKLNKVDSYRVIGQSNIQGSPNAQNPQKQTKKRNIDLNKKSITKENQSNTSAGVGKAQDSVKVSMNNPNSLNDKHRNKHQDQIIGFYKSQQEKTPKKETLRYDGIEEIISHKLSKAQQNNQETKNKRVARKNSTQRNKVQIKLKTLNSINPHFEPLDNINLQHSSHFAVSAKNATAHHNNFTSNMSNSQVKSPLKESFTGSSLGTRNGLLTQDLSSYLGVKEDNGNMHKTSSQMKLKQKISSIMQATSTSQNQSNILLHNSQSQGNLKRESNGFHNQSKLFRPQSLRQIMPTIDEQILRLTESNTGAQDQISQQYLFQTIQNQNKTSSNRGLKQIPMHPQSQFRGQIIKAVTSGKSNRVVIATKFNHKESIEGGELHKKAIDLEQSISNTQVSEDPIKQSLQDILYKTTATIQGLMKREKNLVGKCTKYEEEIEMLKSRLLKYEQPDHQ